MFDLEEILLVNDSMDHKLDTYRNWMKDEKLCPWAMKEYCLAYSVKKKVNRSFYADMDNIKIDFLRTMKKEGCGIIVEDGRIAMTVRED